MTEPEPQTPEAIAASYEASPPATANLLAALLGGLQIDAQQSTADADWPWGSGTVDDPFQPIPGWSPDWTDEQMQAAIAAGKAGDTIRDAQQNPEVNP